MNLVASHVPNRFQHPTRESIEWILFNQSLSFAPLICFCLKAQAVMSKFGHSKASYSAEIRKIESDQ
jgi:hypothetical protein